MKNIVAVAPLRRGLITHRLTGWRVGIALSTTAILLALFALGSRSYAQNESVISVFGYQEPRNGLYPNGVIAKDGIIFGTNRTGGGSDAVGNVFALRPPPTPGEPWSKAVLYNFQNGAGGNTPQGLLLAGANHVLYGVTEAGGNSDNGTVFAVQPPPGGGTPWVETPLHSFAGPPSDGAGPLYGLIADANGTLYGATPYGGSFFGPTGCGAVFSLTPPSTPGGAWTENVLYSFSGGGDGSVPVGGLLLGQHGVLYGATSNGDFQGQGVIYALTPPSIPGGAWVESTVYSFQSVLDGSFPQGDLIADKSGRLFGTCHEEGGGYGSVFELTPPSTPGSPWTEHTVWVFGVVPGDGWFPLSGLTLVDGQFYGITLLGGANQVGTVFQLTPPAAVGSPWTETILHSFNQSSAILDAWVPISRLALGPGGALFGTTENWGAMGGEGGAVYEVTP